MSTPEYPRLQYRGNFRVTAGIDYEGTTLGVEYGGGLSERETIFPPLRYWKLSYPELSRDAMIQLPSGELISRLDYVWNFYCDRLNKGGVPFTIRCPRDKRLYLAEFTDLRLEYELADLFLASTGLSMRQAYVRHMNTLEGGALDEGLENPSTI